MTTREISQSTWDTWQQTECLWSILDAIPDDKIEKSEWDFILKSLGKDEPILSRDESDFLFLYLDKDHSGDISKPELKYLFNEVVTINKWDENNAPTKREMLKQSFEYACRL